MPTFYAQTIFSKPLEQITEADLTSYFQQERDETLNLEFKSGARSTDTKGVLKTISAFLNSSGGLLIWGAPESKEIKRGGKTVKVCKAPLAPVQEELSRDSFFDKIAGNVSPVPVGVRMHPIPIASGGYVYLFDVPESQNKPHQTDGRYYVRMDTRTDAAPHYLVYALCHQIRTPILRIKANVIGTATMYTDYPNSPKARIDFTISNETPFVHDENPYIVMKSSVLSFTTDPHQSSYSKLFSKQDLVRLLPYGLPITLSIGILLPKDIRENAEYTFNMWYGGARSNVTLASFILKCISSSQSHQQISYGMQVTLVRETGLDKQELSSEADEG